MEHNINILDYVNFDVWISQNFELEVAQKPFSTTWTFKALLKLWPFSQHRKNSINTKETMPLWAIGSHSSCLYKSNMTLKRVRSCPGSALPTFFYKSTPLQSYMHGVRVQTFPVYSPYLIRAIPNFHENWLTYVAQHSRSTSRIPRKKRVLLFAFPSWDTQIHSWKADQ